MRPQIERVWYHLGVSYKVRSARYPSPITHARCLHPLFGVGRSFSREQVRVKPWNSLFPGSCARATGSAMWRDFQIAMLTPFGRATLRPRWKINPICWPAPAASIISHLCRNELEEAASASRIHTPTQRQPRSCLGTVIQTDNHHGLP